MSQTVFYEPGATRWRRHDGKEDVRAYRPAKGWHAFAELCDTHPTTGRGFTAPQWWIREEYKAGKE